MNTYSFTSCKHFLNKIDTACFCHAQSGRTSDCNIEIVLSNDVLCGTKHFTGFFPHFGKMTFILLINNRIVAYSDQFDRCRTDIDSKISSAVHKNCSPFALLNKIKSARYIRLIWHSRQWITFNRKFNIFMVQLSFFKVNLKVRHIRLPEIKEF